MGNLVIGVDIGNSKTWALVGDRQGRVLAMGKGGPGNHQAKELGAAGAVAAFATAIDEALTAAGAQLTEVAHVAFCAAGADLPEDYDLLRGAIGQRWPALSFTVHNDTAAGLRAGTSQAWGAVVICGSGTNAMGRGRDGREVQIGGLGYTYGDHGGGADLGRKILRRSFQAAEGRGPDTVLLPQVLAALGLPDADALRSEIYHGRLKARAQLDLAPLAFAAANEGDLVAQEILVRMGTELGKAGGAALKAVDLHRETGVEVVIAGSIWKGDSPLMLDAFRLALHRAAPGAKIVHPRYEPVVGAYLVALDEAKATEAPEVQRSLDESLPANLRLATKEEA